MIHIPLISPHFSSPPLETPARRLSALQELLLLDAAGRPRANPWASPNARPFKTWDGRLASLGAMQKDGKIDENLEFET